tara:strand:- start:9714 stop:10025 length:312 start_codon:yes stop_codon:yes gene_type:complete
LLTAFLDFLNSTTRSHISVGPITVFHITIVALHATDDAFEVFIGKLQQNFYLMQNKCYTRFNIYLTFEGMKNKDSKFKWKQLMELLLIMAIVALLVFVILYIL